jgi:uncharacterized protein (TIGR00251 family)
VGRVSVRIQARARATEIVGWRDGALVVRVTAPPLDGRANEALCALLAERLRVPKRDVSVVRGATARDKVVAVDGLDDAELRRALTGVG